MPNEPQSLPLSEALLQALSESTSFGLFIYQHERFRYVSPAAARALGYSQEELAGLPLWEVVHPDHREMLRERALARRRGEPVPNRYQFKVLSRDGEDRWIDVGVQPFQLDGQPAIVGTAINISARKRAQDERDRLLERLTLLAEASGLLLATLALEDRLQSILELSHRLISADAHAIWRLDPETRTWAVVSALGLSKEYQTEVIRVMGESSETADEPMIFENVDESPLLADRRDLHRREGIRSILAVPLRIRSERSGVLTFYYRESHRFEDEQIRLATALANLAASAIGTSELYEQEKRVRAQAENALDEVRRNEERLRQAQKLESLGLLAGGVAHDFNNLLTSILGNASLALEILPRAHPAWARVSDVVIAGERAADLTRQLLAYSGKGSFVVEPIRFSALVREISSLIQVSLSKKVELEMRLQQDLPPIEGDPSQIQQLVMNLVVNGAEAIGENVGTVRITTGVQEIVAEEDLRPFSDEALAPGCYVWLEVEDSGAGMDEETKARIFDPFFTTKFTGRGLGLAAVLGIVRSHNGSIRVQSTPGKGSIFRVLFPAMNAAGKQDPEEQQAGDLQGAGTILVVDDEESVRHIAKAVLERYGYTVLVADNGRAGAELFRRHADQIHLVLLDMTMPVMSGEEALEQIRGMRRDVAVLASSGYSETEACRRFAQGGITGFIQKPYTSARLTQKVKSVLTKNRATGVGQ